MIRRLHHHFSLGMADLSQLGAAAEDLNEETLQEEECCRLSSSVLIFLSPGTWWRRRHCSCKQDRRREVNRGRARRRAHSCHGYHYWRYETWPGWKVKSVGYSCMWLFLNISLWYRETPVTDEEKAGAAWALVLPSVEVMWHSGPPMWCISCPHTPIYWTCASVSYIKYVIQTIFLVSNVSRCASNFFSQIPWPVMKCEYFLFSWFVIPTNWCLNDWFRSMFSHNDRVHVISFVWKIKNVDFIVIWMLLMAIYFTFSGFGQHLLMA